MSDMNFDPSDPVQEALFRKALADAIDAWLDKQFAKFGKWSFYGILSVGLSALAYLYFNTHGLKP